MQKFYKYFTWAVLILAAAVLTSPLVSSQPNDGNVQSRGDCQHGCCGQHEVVVVENSPERIVHAAYDFSRSTVTLVQIRRGFTPPEITVQSRKLGQ